MRASRGRMRQIVCWRGGWRSAACDLSSFISAGGISTTIYRAISGCSAQVWISEGRGGFRIGSSGGCGKTRWFAGAGSPPARFIAGGSCGTEITGAILTGDVLGGEGGGAEQSREGAGG